jgi:hypothetical protein
MIRQLIVWIVLSGIVMNSSSKALGQAAQTSANPAQDVAAEIRRIGTGNDALVEITLRDGRKLKGFVIEIRQDEFVVAEQKSGRTSIVEYAQVSRLKHRKVRQLSPGARTALAVGVAAGIVTLGIVGYIIGQRPKNSGKTTFP